MGRSENTFSFKSFNQLISSVEIKTRSAIKLHDESYFRQTLLKLYDLDLTDSFVNLFHEIEPKTRSVHLLVLHYDSIVKLLFESINEKNISLLELLSALWMDFSSESLVHAGSFITATMPILSLRDPEILTKLFHSYVVVVKNFISEKNPSQCFSLFSFLLSNDMDYIRHFGCQVLGLLLRTSTDDDYFQMISSVISSPDDLIYQQTIALLIFHSMMNVNESFFSTTKSRLTQLLILNCCSNHTFMSLGYLLCKFGNIDTCTNLANQLLNGDLTVFGHSGIYYFLNCFIRLKSDTFQSTILLNHINNQIALNPSITSNDGVKKVFVELFYQESFIQSNFKLLKSIFKSANINDMMFILTCTIPNNTNMWFTQLLFDFLSRFQSECPNIDFPIFTLMISHISSNYELKTFKNAIIYNGKFNFSKSLFNALYTEYSTNKVDSYLSVLCQFNIDSTVLLELLDMSITHFTPSKLPIIHELMHHLLPTNLPLLFKHLKSNSTNVNALHILYLLRDKIDVDDFNVLDNLSHSDQSIRIASLEILNNKNIFTTMLQCELITDLVQNQRLKCNLINTILITHSNDANVVDWILAQFHVPFKPVWDFIIKLKISNKMIATKWLNQFKQHLILENADIVPLDSSKYVLNYWKNMKLIFPNIHFNNDVQRVVSDTRNTINTDYLLQLLKLANNGNFSKYLNQGDLMDLWCHPKLNLLYATDKINLQYTVELILLMHKYTATISTDLYKLLSNSNDLLQMTAFNALKSDLNKDDVTLITNLINPKSFKDALIQCSFTNDQNIQTDLEYKTKILKYVIPIVHGKLLLKNKLYKSCISTFISLLSYEDMVSFLNLCFSIHHTTSQSLGMLNTMSYLLHELPFNCKSHASLFMEIIKSVKIDKINRPRILDILLILATITNESSYLTYLFNLLPERIGLIHLESIPKPSLFLKAFEIAMNDNHDHLKPQLQDILPLIHRKYCLESLHIGLLLIHWISDGPADPLVLAQIKELPVATVTTPQIQSLVMGLIPNTEFDLLANWIINAKEPESLFSFIPEFVINVSHIKLAIPLLNKSSSLPYRLMLLVKYGELFPMAIQTFIKECYTRHASEMDAVDMDHRYDGLKSFMYLKSDATPLILFVLLDCLDSDESNIRDIVLQLLSQIIVDCNTDEIEYVEQKLLFYLKRNDAMMNQDLIQFVLRTNTPDFDKLQEINKHDGCLMSIVAIQKQDRKDALVKLQEYLMLGEDSSILLKWIYPSLLQYIQDEAYLNTCSRILQLVPAKVLGNILRYQFIKCKLLSLHEFQLLQMYMKSLPVNNTNEYLFILQQLVSNKHWHSKDLTEILGLLKSAKIICQYFNHKLLQGILLKCIHLLRMPKHVRDHVYQLIAMILVKMPDYLGTANELLKDSLCTGLWNHVYRYTLHMITCKLDPVIGKVDYLLEEIYDCCLMEIHAQYKEKLEENLKKSLPEIQTTTYMDFGRFIGLKCSDVKCPEILQKIQIPPLINKRQSSMYMTLLDCLFDGFFNNSYCRNYLVLNYKNYMLSHLDQPLIINAMLHFIKKCLIQKIELEGVVDILGSCLDLTDMVIISALRCISQNVGIFKSCMPLLLKRIMHLLSRNVGNELQIACLKCLSLILPFCEIQPNMISTILTNVSEYLTDTEMHYVACSVIKQLTILKIQDVVFYNVLDLILNYSITNRLVQIRTSMQHLVMHFIQHLALTTKKCTGIVDFYISNLNYCEKSGVLASIDMLSKLHKKLPLTMKSMVQLSLTLGNAKEQDVQLACTTCLNDLFQLGSNQLQEEYGEYIIKWYNSDNKQLTALGLKCLESPAILKYATTIHNFSDLFNKIHFDVVSIGMALVDYNIKFTNVVDYCVNAIEQRLNLNYPDLYKLVIMYLQVNEESAKQLGISLLYRYQIGKEEEFNLIVKLLQHLTEHYDAEFIGFIRNKLVHAAYKGVEYQRRTMIQFTSWLTVKKLMSLAEYFKIVIRCEDDDEINKEEGLIEQLRQSQEMMKKNFEDYYDVYAQTKKEILIKRQARKQQHKQLNIQEPEIAAQVKIKKNLKKVLKRRLKDSEHKAKRLKLQ